MPPSRKRAKGKARKEKNQDQRNISHLDDIRSVIHRGHPVATFMNTYIEAIKRGEKEFDAVNLTQENHPEVWEDERMRKMVINIPCNVFSYCRHSTGKVRW